MRRRTSFFFAALACLALAVAPAAYAQDPTIVTDITFPEEGEPFGTHGNGAALSFGYLRGRVRRRRRCLPERARLLPRLHRPEDVHVRRWERDVHDPLSSPIQSRKPNGLRGSRPVRRCRRNRRLRTAPRPRGFLRLSGRRSLQGNVHRNVHSRLTVWGCIGLGGARRARLSPRGQSDCA
jgi:hypothetical protein